MCHHGDSRKQRQEQINGVGKSKTIADEHDILIENLLNNLIS